MKTHHADNGIAAFSVFHYIMLSSWSVVGGAGAHYGPAPQRPERWPEKATAKNCFPINSPNDEVITLCQARPAAREAL
jgi:hypothetical protein